MTFTMLEADVKALVAMHTYCRPAGTKTERKFIKEFLLPLGLEPDASGNLVKRIGRAPVMWSCHTDTVHRMGGIQRVDVKDGMLCLEQGSPSNCLGADDSAGVWLMREMILAQRPGLYVFHRMEECGGVGSDYIAKRTPNVVCGIQYAIALDRRGTTSVITHQGFGRTASDAFAGEMALRLGGRYAPDDGGVFTDTANYADLIPECTNLSVGYDNEHSSKEVLDVDHLMELREKLLAFDTEGLPADRDPKADPYADWRSYSYGSSNTVTTPKWENDYYSDPQPYGAPRPDMMEMIKRNPEEVADILLAYGITADELADEIYQRGGAVAFA